MNQSLVFNSLKYLLIADNEIENVYALRHVEILDHPLNNVVA